MTLQDPDIKRAVPFVDESCLNLAKSTVDVNRVPDVRARSELPLPLRAHPPRQLLQLPDESGVLLALALLAADPLALRRPVGLPRPRGQPVLGGPALQPPDAQGVVRVGAGMRTGIGITLRHSSRKERGKQARARQRYQTYTQ